MAEVEAGEYVNEKILDVVILDCAPKGESLRHLFERLQGWRAC
jgi:anion-transporting  ArsA/GET3 family ATPase